MRRGFLAGFLALIFLGSPLFFGAGMPAPVSAAPAFGDSMHRRFFSEEFVVFGRDAEGQDILLTLMFCRKEDPDKNNFLHYRFASLVSNAINVDLTDSFEDLRQEEVPHGFLTAFEHGPARDLSTRESYSLKATIGGTSVELRVPELQSDFVVKNTPDYTKLISESPAELRIGGKTLSVRAVVEKIYSADYSIHVFFPGHGKTRSETNAFVLWDEKGNVYILDTSQVSEDNPSYRSHTWALFKDTTRNLSGKAFEAHVAFEGDNPGNMKWKISIPAFQVRQLLLAAVRSKDGKPEEGIARGSIEVGGERRSIAGLYTHHVYR